MRRCLYCTREKAEAEFSEEHILPQGVGGNLTPTNPFKTNDVCRECNTRCGAYVDRPFIRNWFTAQNRVTEARRYIKLTENLALPLNYMGALDGVTHGDRLCEVWLGPTGDTVYHFHRPYPDEPDVPITIGAPPHISSKKIDAGFAITFIVASNPVWWQTILNSVAMQFKGSALYVANANTPGGGSFSDIPSDLTDLVAKLKAMNGVSHKINLAISIDYGDRFLAKLALGMGHLFLEPNFSTSPSAKLLRDAMWERKSEARKKIPLHGQSFLGGNGSFAANLLSWPGGHLICISRLGDQTFLLARFYDSQEAIINLSSDPTHFPREMVDGIVFVVSPGLQAVAGPIRLLDFLTHRQNIGPKNPDLLALEERMRDAASSLPPAHVEPKKPESLGEQP